MIVDDLIRQYNTCLDFIYTCLLLLYNIFIRWYEKSIYIYFSVLVLLLFSLPGCISTPDTSDSAIALRRAAYDGDQDKTARLIGSGAALSLAVLKQHGEIVLVNVHS